MGPLEYRRNAQKMEAYLNKYLQSLRNAQKCQGYKKNLCITYDKISEKQARMVAELECDICFSKGHGLKMCVCEFCSCKTCSECFFTANATESSIMECPSKDTAFQSVFTSPVMYDTVDLQTNKPIQLDTSSDEFGSEIKKAKSKFSQELLHALAVEQTVNDLNQNRDVFTDEFGEARTVIQGITFELLMLELSAQIVVDWHLLWEGRITNPDDSMVHFTDIFNPQHMIENPLSYNFMSFNMFKSFFVTNFTSDERREILAYYANPKAATFSPSVQSYIEKMINFIDLGNMVVFDNIITTIKEAKEALEKLQTKLFDAFYRKGMGVKNKAAVVGVRCLDKECFRGVIDILNGTCVVCRKVFCLKCLQALPRDKDTGRFNPRCDFIDKMFSMFTTTESIQNSRNDVYMARQLKSQFALKKEAEAFVSLFPRFSPKSVMGAITEADEYIRSLQTKINFVQIIQTKVDQKYGAPKASMSLDEFDKILESVLMIEPGFAPYLEVFGTKPHEEKAVHVCPPSNDHYDIVRDGVRVRQCPICRILIEKVPGTCDVMFCLRCKCMFNWRSGEVGITGHNDELAAFLNRLKKPGVSLDLTIDYSKIDLHDPRVPLSFFAPQTDADIFVMSLERPKFSETNRKIPELLRNLVATLHEISVAAYKIYVAVKLTDLPFLYTTAWKMSLSFTHDKHPYDKIYQAQKKLLKAKSLIIDVNKFFYFLHRWMTFYAGSEEPIDDIYGRSEFELFVFLNTKITPLEIAINETFNN